MLLHKSLLNAESDGVGPSVGEQVQCTTSIHNINTDSLTLKHQLRWLRLLGSGLVVEAHHLCNAESGAEFACVLNHDCADFMTQENFNWYILNWKNLHNQLNGTYWMKMEVQWLSILWRMKIRVRQKHGCHTDGAITLKHQILQKLWMERVYMWV